MTHGHTPQHQLMVCRVFARLARTIHAFNVYMCHLLLAPSFFQPWLTNAQSAAVARALDALTLATAVDQAAAPTLLAAALDLAAPIDEQFHPPPLRRALANARRIHALLEWLRAAAQRDHLSSIAQEGASDALMGAYPHTRMKRKYGEASDALWRELNARACDAHNRDDSAYQFLRARCLFYGIGGERVDVHAAVALYTEGSRAGFAPSQCSLGFCYENAMGGLVEDKQKAFELFQLAAAQGHPQALFNCAISYRRGLGCDVDLTRQFECYERSAVAGLPMGQVWAGMSYLKGDGVAQDEAAAVAWFRRAVDADEPDGLCQLAWCYANGVGGVVRDRAQAREYAQRAADQGLESAKRLLQNL